jgi:dTDP-4-dehydrorhamnose reductase
MKILLTGAGGQLGRELSGLLPRLGHETVALGRGEMDVGDFDSVEASVEAHGPDVVVNAAAYTDVDGCETEAEAAYRVNALGPRNLAQVCQRRGCEILHVSTNYVFDGKAERPYEAFDPPNPLSAYGRTKLAGEEYVQRLSNRWYIVRSAGVYGEGRNFVGAMLRVAKERDVLKVKDDEFISPTYARDLAEGIARIIEGRRYGVYHVTNSGSCSWHEFAVAIFEFAGVEIEVRAVPGSEYPLPAARPANGILSALGSPDLPHWRDALARYLERSGVARG